MYKNATRVLVFGFLFPGLFSLLSCKKDEEYKPAPSLSPSSNRLTANPEGGERTFNLLGTVKWTATSNSPWAALVRSSGANDSYVSLNVDSNFSADSRTALVTIKGEGVDAFDVRLTQSPGVIVNQPTGLGSGVSLDSYPYQGGNFTLSIFNSLQQRLRVSSNAAWLKLPADINTASSSLFLNVEVENNTGSGNRTAKITIQDKNGNTIREITVTQTFDQFLTSFYNVNWRLNSGFTSTGPLTMPPCQIQDVYRFVGNSVTRNNAGGSGCNSGSESGTFTVGTSFSGQRMISTNFFADITGTWWEGDLIVDNFTATRMVLANTSGTRFYEFIRL